MSDDHDEDDGEDRLVHCDSHGEQTAAFVCRHLLRKPAERSAGFNWWLDDTDPVALCDACAAEVGDVSPWPDEFVDDNLRLICRNCFLDIAEAHGVPPEAIESAEAAERGDLH